MKNSNKWGLAALLVLLGSLTAYNMGLRTEYRRGTYKDPLRDYAALNFKNFTEVAVPAASTASVKIVAGPFGVRVAPFATEFVHISQQGGRLVVAAAFPAQRNSLAGRDVVVISCPRLAALATDAVYQLEGQPQVDKSFSYDFGGHRVLVQGFAQDSLVLRQDRGSRVELAGNRLGYLRAVAGASAGSNSILQINSGNRIGAADLDLRHRSELLIDNVAIPRLRYHFDDSAKATLSGAALASLRP